MPVLRRHLRIARTLRKEWLNPTVPIMTLCRVIYTSHMAPLVDMQALVAQAQKNNRRSGITGALTTLQSNFFQYLEGDAAAVDQLFLAIQNDARHFQVKLLERREIPRRLFADWTMAHMVWNEDMRAVFHSFSPGAPLDLYETDPSTAAPLFRAWMALLPRN